MLSATLVWILGSTTAQVVCSLFVCLSIGLLFEKLVECTSSTRYPRIGKSPVGWRALADARADFMKNGRTLVEEGYRKYKNSIYVVQTADMERLIISNKYIDELRSLPQTTLNSKDAQCDRHLAWWNTLDVVKNSDLHIMVSRAQLNHNIGAVVDEISEEADLAWSEGLQQCFDKSNAYHTFTANQIVVNTVSRMVNRTIVGVPVCRNPEFFASTLGYAAEAFQISAALRPHSRLFRPFIYMFLGARHRLRAHIETANRILNPVIEDRTSNDPSQVNMLQWMIDKAEGNDKQPSELTHKTLFLCLASIVSSTMGVTNAIFDLCQYPEYIEPLREEIAKAVREEGGWNLAAAHKWDKLDSFLKESQRVNHPGLFSFNRKVLKDVQLSDGNLLPAGSFISVPTYCFTKDPDYHEFPESFKPFRYYEQRMASPEDSKKYYFSSTSPSSMAFGHGLSACPGRFFAGYEMKMALARFLDRYDFRFPEGQTERPLSVYVDERIWPSRTQQIDVRARAHDSD